MSKCAIDGSEELFWDAVRVVVAEPEDRRGRLLGRGTTALRKAMEATVSVVGTGAWLQRAVAERAATVAIIKADSTFRIDILCCFGVQVRWQACKGAARSRRRRSVRRFLAAVSG